MPMISPSPIEVAAGAGTDGGQRPTVVPALAATSPELSARPQRRVFTAKDKLRILAEADRASKLGDITAILRREGLYSSALTDWRRQRDAGAFGALTPQKRGRKTEAVNPLTAERAALQRENLSLTRRLARAEAVIDIQKNCSAGWDTAGSRRRRDMTNALAALSPASGITKAACAALGISRASVQRRRVSLSKPRVPRPPRRQSPRALTAIQQKAVLDLLH